jgi:hypothetical protein
VAFYLKELVQSDIVKELFKMALQNSIRKQDLWWQIRALEELGRATELRQLLIRHRSRIIRSNDLFLQSLLAKATGDTAKFVKLQKRIAEGARMALVRE